MGSAKQDDSQRHYCNSLTESEWLVAALSLMQLSFRFLYLVRLMIRRVQLSLTLALSILVLPLAAQVRDTLIRIEANPKVGFNFPCYLYLPAECSPLFRVSLIVEPNNTGIGSDSFSVHENAARLQATQGPIGHYLAEQLRMPLLVPVFPRPEKNWHLYTHMLDRDVMKITKGELKRIDLQLLAMIDAARETLFELGFVTEQQIIMSGYSSSGVFANRFAALHPLWVKGYAAGGINGMMLMPHDAIDKTQLCYPLGTADFEKIRKEIFDLDAFRKVAQVIYMGELDTNDAVLFDDGYSEKERRIVFKLLGEEMIPDRWGTSQAIYRAAGLHVQFKTYPGIGHEINAEVREDLVAFFRAILSTSRQN